MTHELPAFLTFTIQLRRFCSGHLSMPGWNLSPFILKYQASSSTYFQYPSNQILSGSEQLSHTPSSINENEDLYPQQYFLSIPFPAQINQSFRLLKADEQSHPSNSGYIEEVLTNRLERTLILDAAVDGWARALALRDQDTFQHTLRVTKLTILLSRKMGIHEEQLPINQRGAKLHDIGKMGIPDKILHKPGPLNADDWSVMRKHPRYAYEMLAHIPYMETLLDIPYCHHEKWDGSGYPRGLKEAQIPLPARIFAVVDVWDALRSDRPYRPAWPQDQTIQYLLDQSGTHFDPQVVTAFLQILDEV